MIVKVIKTLTFWGTVIDVLLSTENGRCHSRGRVSVVLGADTVRRQTSARPVTVSENARDLCCSGSHRRFAVVACGPSMQENVKFQLQVSKNKDTVFFLSRFTSWGGRKSPPTEPQTLSSNAHADPDRCVIILLPMGF